MSKKLEAQFSRHLAHWREKVAVPGMRALLAALVVCVCLVSYISWYWTSDLEESAKISYSAGAALSSPMGQYGRDTRGIHSVLGVPVYDTMQGTGNRLPSQASWAQSVTWPLRFLVSLQQLTTIRTFFFALPTMWLVMLMLLSWIPRLTLLRLSLFGFLISAPFGLYLRQNEWSDTYVQTAGILGVCFWLLHRSFFDATTDTRCSLNRFVPIALLVSLNAVLTGHPGVWPNAFIVWLLLFVSLSTDSRFRINFRSWLASNKLMMLLTVGTGAVTVGTVALDLRTESLGLSFGADRLSLAQGFYGDQVFRGLSRGLLPDLIERLLSIVATSALKPLFTPFHSLVSSHDTLARLAAYSPRSEFAATLVAAALLFGYQRLEDLRLRAILPRIFLAQFGVVTFAVVAAQDAVPAILTPSGAWQLFPVLFVMNAALSIVLLSSITKGLSLPRVLLRLNLIAVAIWSTQLLLAPPLLSFDNIEPPARFQAWFSDDVREANNEASRALPDSQRTIFLGDSSFGDSELPHWSVFLELVSRGRPVVAPADPKIRNSTHLIESISFNNSIGYWVPGVFLPNGNHITTSKGHLEVISQRVDLVTDFLQIRTVLMRNSPRDDDFIAAIERAGFRDHSNTVEGGHTMTLRGREFRVLIRQRFHVFSFYREELPPETRCAVLVEKCKVLSAEKSSPRESSPLRTCQNQECLWKYDAPSFRSDKVLIIPVTYDRSIEIADNSGRPFPTYDVGGFLGVGSDDDVQATEMVISMNPDLRTGLRVFTSYFNLLTLILAALLTTRRRPRSGRLTS
jgi:hypothetical protein